MTLVSTSFLTTPITAETSSAAIVTPTIAAASTITALNDKDYCYAISIMR